jgi:DNA polymerase-3 subunit delta
MADAAFVVDFVPLSADRIAGWIAHHAETTLSSSISEAAARLLHDAGDRSLPHSHQELDKPRVTRRWRHRRDAVRAVVGVRSGETLADLLDAVADRNASRAMALVPMVLSQPKSNAVTIIMALATDGGRGLGGQRARCARHRNRTWFLFAPEGREGVSWPRRRTPCHCSARRNAGPRQLAHALDALAADIAAKESRVSSEEQLLTSLVLALCAYAERRAA